MRLRLYRGFRRHLIGPAGIGLAILLLLALVEGGARGAPHDGGFEGEPAEANEAVVASAGEAGPVVARADEGSSAQAPGGVSQAAQDSAAPSAVAPPTSAPFETGKASYYHSSLEGRSTANGEPYRSAELTAAHRSLPFGTVVRVINLSNGRSVVVRINDRGPFVSRRVIDLSKAAARELRMVSDGLAPVELEIVEPAGS